MRLFLLLVAFAITGFAQAAPSANQKALVQYLISQEEPTIKDATWSTDENLYVGVIDDGSDRSGFADYVCATATERGAHARMVKVIDIVKVVRTGKFHALGKSRCR